MITYKDKLSPPEVIVDSLQPAADYVDPKRTLRALVFRLRKALSDNNAKDFSNIVAFSHGCYKLDLRDCWLDIEEFENLFKRAYDITKDAPGEAIDTYKKALELYHGDYLSETYGHEWLIPTRNHYRRIYLQIIYEVSELLKKQKRFSEIITICEKALKHETFEEEIHLRYIEALTGEGKLKQARSHYEYVAEIFEREMGVKPSKAMQNLYRLLFGEINKSGLDLASIKENLREECFADTPVLCDIEFFRFLYQLEKRRAERYGRKSFLGILTLTLPDHTLPPKKQVKDGMKDLRQLLLTYLRKGDVLTEWNEAQFVLSLPGLNIDQANTALDRMQKMFMAKYKDNGLIVHRKVQEVLPTESFVGELII
ncbi:MAG: BTAD domain-containing putative transcriptional regulator [Bacillota bacterium]